MKNLLRFRKFVLIMSVVFYFISCRSERDNNMIPSGNLSQDSIKVYSAFLSSLGLNEEIKYRPAEYGFLIGGDVFTPLSDVRARYQLSRSQRNAKPNQWRNFYIVDQSIAKNIRVYVDGSVPPAWSSAVTDAVEYWNSVPETQVQFKITTSLSLAQVKISTNYDSDLATVAIGDAPSTTGLPGYNIRINTNSSVYSSTDNTLLKLAIAHEMGHTIGLMHTNTDYYNNPPLGSGNVQFISGTSQPGQDPNSLMNSVVNTSKYITNSDLIAIRTLYPFTFSAWVDKPRGSYEELSSVAITWDNSVISSSATLTISLHDVDDVFVTTLATNVPNTGSWTVSGAQMRSRGITQDGSYLINIQETGNASHKDSSDNPFLYLAD